MATIPPEGPVRRFVIALLSALTLAVSTLVLVPSNPAGAATLTTLRDLQTIGTGSFTLTAFECDGVASDSFSYSMTSPVSGPVTGTHRETGTITLGAATSYGRQAVTALSASFTVEDGAGVVVAEGTKQLAPGRDGIRSSTYYDVNEAVCATGAHHVTTAFEASSGGVVFERGHSNSGSRSWSPAWVDYWVLPRLHLVAYATSESGGVGPIGHPTGHGTFVQVSPAPINDVSFRVRSTGGTATAGSDYHAYDSVITVPGQAGPALWGPRPTITLVPIDDALIEPIETVELELSQATGAYALNTSAVAQIVDNEAVVSLSAAAEPESNPDVDVVVSLAAPMLSYVDVCLQPAATSTAENVVWSPHHGEPIATTDFHSDARPYETCDGEWAVHIPPGQLSVTHRLPERVIDDLRAEWDEVIEYQADWVVGGTIDPTASVARRGIIDDDGDADMDLDGILDLVDLDPNPLTVGDSSNHFADETTVGSVDATGGNTVQVSDAPAPDGIRVLVSTETTTPATVIFCRGTTGEVTVTLSPGSDTRHTCGSITTSVQAGSATLEMGGTVVELPAGVEARVADGGATVSVLQDTPTAAATVARAGVTTTLSVSDNPDFDYVSSVSGPNEPVLPGRAISVEPFLSPAGALQPSCVIDWGDGGQSRCEPGAAHAYANPGVHKVEVTVTDAAGRRDTAAFEYVVVYDPSGGYVTGGGWIDSPSDAYTPGDTTDEAVTGKAHFGFVSRYEKGATVPSGQTQFSFRAGDLRFHSTSYEWLVVSGSKAQYKGSGHVNGVGGHGFLLTATDGQLNGGTGADRFRIKIWDESGTTLYDNGASGSGGTAISGGSIVIHK